MTPIITYVLMFFLGLYGLYIIVELIASRRVKRFVIQLVILVVVVLLFRATTGFPATRTAFGGVSPILAMAIMLVCTILGIAAHYFFNLEGGFSWRAFLKPLFISPIVLLPLVGSVQGITEVETIQMISFGFLAFQNGFFWREVFEHAKKQVPQQT